MAGVIVGMVAIPLGMALAIATGVPPQLGLYTIIVGGGLVALLGGSRYQVTGPTAAFVVILVPIVHRFGVPGLLMAGFMAGVILVIMGLAKVGQFIEYVPHPVTTGFTSGIAVVIASLQIKDFFGLQLVHVPEGFVSRLRAYVEAAGTFSFSELAVGAGTLIILVMWPRLNKKIPSPVVALVSVTVATAIVSRYANGFSVATIGSRFGGIPRALPSFQWPGGELISLASIRSLLPSSFAIATLAAIESLLSAVASDGMTGTHHDPDSELLALGLGNMACPLFGGIPATGAIARTATNIRFGAKSPLAALVHALFVLCAVLLFAPYLSFVPMASMAALLLLVAYNMSELKNFGHILAVAPRRDVLVLLICFGLTVMFDMVIGVTVGIALASVLFMRKIAFITTMHAVTPQSHRHLDGKIPPGVQLYEISGPLFFAAAGKAVGTMSSINSDAHTVVFLMDKVLSIDITGLVAFESAVRKLTSSGRRVVLAGVRHRPQLLMERSGLLDEKNVRWYPTESDAMTDLMSGKAA
jgi:SulP family sulfate permease